MAVVDHMKEASIPLKASEWDSAIAYAGRCIANVSATEVESALHIWREMEQEAGVKSGPVTFNILFNIATKAGKLVLAEMILDEMQRREVAYTDHSYTGIMFYQGVKGNGAAIRTTYREMVEAGHTVGIVVLDCVISSLIRAGELPAAEQVYERMKDLAHRQTGKPIHHSDYRAPREFIRTLDTAAQRASKRHHSSWQLQAEQCLAPGLRRVAALVEDMRIFDVPLDGLIMLRIFKGFAFHGGTKYTSWTRQRLELVWASLLSMLDKEMDNRGGGGSGDGGGSNFADSPWGVTVDLEGSHFNDPYATALLVFHAIGLVGILVIMIWAKSFKKVHDVNKRLFRWYAFWLSAATLFVYFAIRFSVAVIYEVEAEVYVLFYLIIQIIYQSAFIAEMTLLVMLYLLLPHCTSHPDHQSSRSSLKKGAKIAHAILIVILVALWLASMALKIKYQVDTVIGDSLSAYYRSTVRSFNRLDLAYAILYFFATLEIAAWTILASINAKKKSQSVQMQLILPAAVAAPLLLRSTYEMGIAISDELQQRSSTRGLFLARDIVYTLNSLAVYAGIVAICWNIARSGPPPPDPSSHSYDPNFWAAGGNQVANHDPKNPMAVNVAAAPPANQYAGHYAPQQPQQQPPYANQAPYQQQQQQQQQPYPNNAVSSSSPYQQPYYRGPGSPPPPPPPPQQAFLYPGGSPPPVHQQQQQQQLPYQSPTATMSPVYQ
ncbi:MAG: hypothetical protein LQ348_004648 [Seirophora lacunosa]|nr:MAG: hypothetical protein LQ344_001709 [Seirophora lacunosa]KAI4183626.1 MAG: hypothetical protein LQ348_004648 [Seirophora lacunosa]